MFKDPPHEAELRLRGETESQGVSAGVGGVGSQVGLPSSPLIHLFMCPRLGMYAVCQAWDTTGEKMTPMAASFNSRLGERSQE